MENIYLQKYLKYKKKYIDMINQAGGGIIIMDTTNRILEGMGNKKFDLQKDAPEIENIIANIRSNGYTLREYAANHKGEAIDLSSGVKLKEQTRYIIGDPKLGKSLADAFGDQSFDPLNYFKDMSESKLQRIKKLLPMPPDVVVPKFSEYKDDDNNIVIDLTTDRQQFIREPIKPLYKIDSQYTRALLENGLQPKILFDTGNAVVTITSINYARALNLDIKEIYANDNQIDAFNLHVSENLKIRPINLKQERLVGLHTFRDLSKTVLKKTQGKKYGLTPVSELVDRCTLFIDATQEADKRTALNDLLTFIGLKIVQGFGGGVEFVEKESMVNIKIQVDSGAPNIIIKLRCFLVNNKNDKIIVSNDNIIEMSKRGIIIEYPFKSQAKRLLINELIKNIKESNNAALAIIHYMENNKQRVKCMSKNVSGFTPGLANSELETLKEKEQEILKQLKVYKEQLKHLKICDIDAERINCQ